MLRARTVATLMAIGIFVYYAPSAKADYQPRPGYWHETLVLKNETVPSHSSVVSSSSYPATCVNSLHADALKVEQSNGYVWSDTTFGILSYVEQPGLADIKYEVIEFKCIFDAWPAPEPKK
jgi:hypothetical protein